MNALDFTPHTTGEQFLATNYAPTSAIVARVHESIAQEKASWRGESPDFPHYSTVERAIYSALSALSATLNYGDKVELPGDVVLTCTWKNVR